MTQSGNFVRVQANGTEFSTDVTKGTYSHKYEQNQVGVFNTGIQQAAPGMFNPTLNLNGFIRSGVNQITARNLFAPSGVTAASDTAFVTSVLVGQNALPTCPQAAGATQYQGDAAFIFQGTLINWSSPRDPKGQMQFDLAMQSRGLVSALGNVIVDATAKGTQSYILDSGANAVGTTKGGLACLQIYTPTGTAATGNITVATQPVAADTVVVGGVTYTWRAALTPTAGEVLIGASATVSAQNLYAAMTGGNGSGTLYAAGTTVAPTTAQYGVPTGASNTISVTYATTGTTGNSFTLAKTGTGGLAVSGATLSGGVAGETLTGTIATATSSGGSYTTKATFAANGTTSLAEIQTIAAGVTLDRFVKFTATMSGSTMNIGLSVAFARFWF